MPRPFEILQGVVAQAPHASHDYSAGLAAYVDVYYRGGLYPAVLDKAQTYTVEAQTAERRHSLAHLQRKTRCFSRCLIAMWRALERFVPVWSRRQLHQRMRPEYPTNLIDFVSRRD